MRQIALLLCVALLGCPASPPATKPAPEAAPKVEPAPGADLAPEADLAPAPLDAGAPAVDIDALLARDGIITPDDAEIDEETGIGKRELLEAAYHELSGEGPPELVISTYELRGEGVGIGALWLYDVSDVGAPRPLPTRGARASHTAPRKQGALSWDISRYELQWRVEDVDGDGRVELIVVGDTADVTAGSLAVWSWGRDVDGVEGMIDRLWRDPGGFNVVAADVDGDGRRELVSILPALREPGALPRLIALKPDEQGRWREAAVDLKVGLPAMLDALSQGPPGADEAMPAVLSLMEEHRVAPRDVAALQRALEAQLVGPTPLQALSWCAAAMVWPGNTSAYDVLLPYLKLPGAADEVAGPLLALDALAGETRGRAALLAWLDATLARSLSADDDPDEVEEADTVLQALEAHKIEDGARLAAARIIDPATPPETRRALITRSTRLLYDQLNALSPLWSAGVCDPLCEVFLETLGEEVVPHMSHASRWREALKVEVLRAWLALPKQRARAAPLALASGDPALREQVWALLMKERSSKVRDAIMAAASALAAPMLDLDRALILLTRATGIESLALWQWAVGSGEPALLLAMLERSPEGLSRIFRALDMPEVPCVSVYGGPPGCERPRGALADSLPALHPLVAASLSSSDPQARSTAIELMALMPYAPAQQLLLDLARGPSSPLAAQARAALLRAGHVTAQDYLFEEVTGAAPAQEEALFESLGRAMDAAVAQRLVDWLAKHLASAAPDQDAQAFAARRNQVWRGASSALASAAPRACAAQPALLASAVDDAAHTCEIRVAAATALALCDASWLEQLASEARLKECEGALLTAPLEQVAARGQRAHLPALERLAEDPRARVIRELAHGAAVKIKAR